jgi:hypothetical protein
MLPIPPTLLPLLQTVLFSFRFVSLGTSPACNSIAEVNFLALKPTQSYLHFSKGSLVEPTGRLVCAGRVESLKSAQPAAGWLRNTGTQGFYFFFLFDAHYSKMFSTHFLISLQRIFSFLSQLASMGWLMQQGVTWQKERVVRKMFSYARNVPRPPKATSWDWMTFLSPTITTCFP